MVDGTATLNVADAVKPTRSDPVSPRAARRASRRHRRPLGDQRHLLHAGQERLAGLGKFRAVGHAMKQRCTDLSFQVLDLLAERWLADANLGRRPS